MIFQDLTAGEKLEIERVGDVRLFEPGASLIREGIGGTSSALIVSGKAEVRKSLSGGRDKKLALKPRDPA